MTMRTSELTDIALDWAVAQCEGVINGDALDVGFILEGGYTPSTDWHEGGAIIEREKIELEWGGNGGNENWWACINADEDHSGETPLIAAMRCYVASKLGDEVEVPTELTQGA